MTPPQSSAHAWKSLIRGAKLTSTSADIGYVHLPVKGDALRAAGRADRGGAMTPATAPRSLGVAVPQRQWTDVEEEYDLVKITPAQRTVLHTLARAAIDHGGLRLPAFRVGIFQPGPMEDYLPNGVTHHALYPGPVLVLLRVDLSPRELRRVYLHELQHVHDARDPDLCPDERERNAEAFERTMATWWQR